MAVAPAAATRSSRAGARPACVVVLPVTGWQLLHVSGVNLALSVTSATWPSWQVAQLDIFCG